MRRCHRSVRARGNGKVTPYFGHGGPRSPRRTRLLGRLDELEPVWFQMERSADAELAAASRLGLDVPLYRPADPPRRERDHPPSIHDGSISSI